MREAGTIRERIFNALIKRYTADGEEALVKIDALLKGEVRLIAVWYSWSSGVQTNYDFSPLMKFHDSGWECRIDLSFLRVFAEVIDDI